LLRSGFQLEELAGMVFSPLTRTWRLSTDTAVNYIGSWTRVLAG
jgi:2-polyprenyl-3-methyl-5-hydroxy-6-metoxy-1,4-benzoquinol methylase